MMKRLKLMELGGFLFIYFLAVPMLSSSTGYQNEYGLVVSERVENRKPTNAPKDLMEFLSAQLSEVNFTIVNYQEKIEYYSSDGTTPTLFHFMDRKMCYSITVKMDVVYDVAVITVSNTLHKLKIIRNVNEDGLLIYDHTHYQLSSGLLPSLSCYPSSSIYEYTDTNDLTCSDNIHCHSVIGESDWSKVTIATYNIWNINSTANEWHWNRLNRLAKELSKYDIIGLQEVRSLVDEETGKHINQIERLRKVLPTHQFIYQPGMLFSYDRKDEEGVAIMSRYPIVSTEYILLPWNRSDPSDFHQRVCLQCTIQVSSSKALINVFVTHLSLSGSAQMRSAIEIYHYIQKFPGPSILLGDLNCEPDSPPIMFFNGQRSINGLQLFHGFVDLWKQFHVEDDTGNTFCTLSKTPEKRIDYMFLTNDGSVCAESVQVIGKDSNSGPPLSDHFGLSATIRIQSSTRS